jgi:hypothetical protein
MPRRRVHPEVDEVDLGVAADGEEVAARGRHARDVNRIAGLEHGDDLFRTAVDERDLAAVTQGHREEIIKVQIVFLAGRPVRDRHQDLPALRDLGQAVFGRLRRLVQQITRHEIDVVRTNVARRAPVGHAARRAVVDEGVQIVVAEFLGDVGGERLAGGTLAQHAVAAGASFKIDLLGAGEFLSRHCRHPRFLTGSLQLLPRQHIEAGYVFAARGRLVFLQILRFRRFGGLGRT